ncbi:MAG: hypothetical protein PVJ39_16125 [Gammaproteobacteria bacterium]|jgi:hypothetical protein
MKLVIRTILLLMLLSGGLGANAQELKSGTVVGRHIFGLARNASGKPLMIGDQPLVYRKTIADIPVVKGNSHFVFSVFKHDIGSIYLTRMDADNLKYIDTVAIDMSSAGGVTKPDSGVVTPWGTLLLNENRLIDAANPKEFVEAYSPYFARNTKMVEPYNYGWNMEAVLLNEAGDAKLIKNYALGRLFASQVLIMPDKRSIYLYDGSYSRNLYLFVADADSSLVKGSLYVVQRIGKKYQYLKLGKSSALKMKFRLKRATFSNMFDAKKPKKHGCDAGFSHLQTVFGEECLKERKRARKYAGIFEPIRVSAIRGVTPVVSGADRMRYDEKSNTIVFSASSKIVAKLALGADGDINSNFVIRESL